MEWATIDLPNPPGFLPDSASPYQIEKTTLSEPFPLKLDLLATQDAWVEVETDGHGKYKNLIRAKQTLSFDATQRIRIRTGNAPGLELQFNGEVVVNAGAKRRVRVIEFTNEGVRDLNSQSPVTKS